MDKRTFGMLAMVVAIMCVALLISARQAEGTMSREGQTTIINTQQIGKNVKGFKGATPVKIYIVGNKVTKVEALPNHETPKFFDKAKAVLAKYEGKTVSKASKMNVDGVSGATFSSNALKENVKLGLEYYKKHK